MPRNTTGGSGHKGRANGEGNTAKKNRGLVEDYLEDIRSEGQCEDVYLARVIRRMGDGRMEVFYAIGDRGCTASAPIKGALRGRGKAQAHIDIGSAVLVQSTGLKGSLAFEIIAVLTNAQLDQLNKIKKVDARILAKDITSAEELVKGQIKDDSGFAFDYSGGGDDPDIGSI
jgi:hypothetical protein